jgi:hypothetical protein
MVFEPLLFPVALVVLVIVVVGYAAYRRVRRGEVDRTRDEARW